MKRRPAVAGQFYSASSSGLEEEVRQYLSPSEKKEHVIGMVSPHAGLMFSGAVAGAIYSRIELPHTLILLGPNHTGLGKAISIVSSGEWEIPSGDFTIDGEIAKKILSYTNVIEEDSSAHAMEHSLEVQLPFIHHFSPDARIVPVIIMTVSLDACKMVGEAIARAVESSKYKVTIVASSDMSHYEEDATAREKDKKAIDRILSLDPEGLYETVQKEGISMCGFVPATTMLFAAKQLGAREAALVKYMTSGEVNGDFSRVVGYAGIMVK
jgi:AmmeMemoRadiSam system protein B